MNRLRACARRLGAIEECHPRIARIMTNALRVRVVDESNVAAVFAFLEQHADTSMLLLGILKRGPGFSEVLALKEILQALDLRRVRPPTPDLHVRHLGADDFQQWDRLIAGYCAEEGLPM